jgi:hypothetical protein
MTDTDPAVEALPEPVRVLMRVHGIAAVDAIEAVDDLAAEGYTIAPIQQAEDGAALAKLGDHYKVESLSHGRTIVIVKRWTEDPDDEPDSGYWDGGQGPTLTEAVEDME